MADIKISALPASTTPLAGTEVLPIVQSGTTKQVAISDVTAGRAVSAASLSLTTTPLAVGSGGTNASSFTTSQVTYFDGTRLVGNTALQFNGTTLTVANDASISGLTVGRGAGAVATNTAVGVNALLSNSTGIGNTAVGHTALYTNTTGFENTAIGRGVLYSNTTGSFNTAVGANDYVVGPALQTNTTGSYNNAFGNGALATNVSGNSNSAFGFQALNKNTASYNTAVGYAALYSNTTGAYTTGLGYNAANLCTGSYNLVLGANAGGALTSGVQNTIVGYGAGAVLATGNNNVYVGDENSASSSSVSDEYVIGRGQVGKGTNTITIGKGSTNFITNTYTTNGTWTQNSDERIKKNIQNDFLGLGFINKLRPVTFQWRPSYEIPDYMEAYNKINDKDTETVMHGMLAQEVKAALDDVGVTTFGGWGERDADGLQYVSAEMFIYPLINAIKELSAQVEELKQKVK